MTLCRHWARVDADNVAAFITLFFTKPLRILIHVGNSEDRRRFSVTPPQWSVVFGRCSIFVVTWTLLPPLYYCPGSTPRLNIVHMECFFEIEWFLPKWTFAEVILAEMARFAEMRIFAEMVLVEMTRFAEMSLFAEMIFAEMTICWSDFNWNDEICRNEDICRNDFSRNDDLPKWF